jgi:hypothetical protein
MARVVGPSNANPTHSKAITLTELLLAAAIMAFVISGIIALFVNCTLLNEGSHNLTIAVSHAQHILEEIRGEDVLDDIKAMIDNQGFTQLSGLTEEDISVCCFNLPWVDAESSCLASCLNDAGDPLGIYVRVTWENRRGRAMYTEFHTLMTDY